MRVVLLLLLILAGVLPARAAPAEHEPAPATDIVGDGVIVPGQRLGPLRLTMTIQQMIDAIGGGHRREEFPAEKIILYEWRAPSIWVSLDMQTRAVRVISAFGANSKYRTDKGVRLLEPFTKAESVYGKGYKRWEFGEEKVILIRYPDLGLQFGVVNDPAQRLVLGRIFQIGIFRPGDLPPARSP